MQKNLLPSTCQILSDFQKLSTSLISAHLPAVRSAADSEIFRLSQWRPFQLHFRFVYFFCAFHSSVGEGLTGKEMGSCCTKVRDAMYTGEGET